MAEHVCSIRDVIDGTTAIPSEELTPILTDSDSGASLHPQLASTSVSVEKALARAEAVHDDGTWFGLPIKERAAALRTLQSEITLRAEELGHADSLDTGVPHTATMGLIGAVSSLLEVAAGQIEEGFGHDEQDSSAGTCDQWRLPWGPAAIFLPWNAPAATAIVKTAEALTAGCPVVIKPSEWAPHFSGAFAEAVGASLPDAVIQILHGDRTVGQAVVGDERIAAVSYTGGVAGGTAVAEACARQLKPVDLELSGNNPVVVLPDADPGFVAEQVVTAMLMLNGQYCVGPRRLIVPAGEVDNHLAALETALDAVTIGATSEATTQLGPLAHEPHQRRIEDRLTALADRGCEVRRHGTLPNSGGHFMAPTVVLADKAPELREEIFGPVLLVRTYGDVDEAITIANDHPYGLAGYVFGQDRDAARSVGRRLRAGLVRLNSPFGPPDASGVSGLWGVSGLGQLGSGEVAKFFSGARYVG